MAVCAVTTLLLVECDSGKATRRSLAVLYALLIARSPEVGRGDWRRVNEAVNAALDLDTARKIDGFRKVAWGIFHRTSAFSRSAMPVPAHEAPLALQ